MSQTFDSAISFLPSAIRLLLHRLPAEYKCHIQEVRLRLQKPICIKMSDQLWFLDCDGNLQRTGQFAMQATKLDLANCLRSLCEESVYAYEEHLRSGFLTAKGGHRVGLCGTAVIENGKLQSVRNLTSLHLRIARDVPGCADRILTHLKKTILSGLLVTGPPGSGKTTMLRDLCFQIASGKLGRYYTVALLDERGEFSGLSAGVPAFSVGECCDIFYGYPKAEGIRQAIRTMAPKFLICDEICSEEDLQAIIEAVGAGVALIASVHTESLDALQRRSLGKELLKTGAFGHIVFLHPDQIEIELCALEELENVEC